MSLVKLFSDELSLLNNRESLYKIYLPRDEVQSIFDAPPHNLGTDNLLVFVDGLLKIKDVDYEDLTSDSIRFLKEVDVESTILIFLIRTGADYTYGNTAIAQWYHGSSDPSPDSGKNDDYFLNIESGDLFCKQNGFWVKIFTFGEGGGGDCPCDGGFARFASIIFESLSYERTNPLAAIPLGQKIGDSNLMVYVNGFLIDRGRDYQIVGEELIFSKEIGIDKDVIVYKLANDDSSGNFSLINKSLSGERSELVNSFSLDYSFRSFESELIFLNGFLLIPGRDYSVLNRVVYFTFEVKIDWDLYFYKIGEGEIFGFGERVLDSPRDSRAEVVDRLELTSIDWERDKLLCFYNGFLLVIDRDYHIGPSLITFTFDIPVGVDIVVFRWSNRVKNSTQVESTMVWSRFDF